MNKRTIAWLLAGLLSVVLLGGLLARSLIQEPSPYSAHHHSDKPRSSQEGDISWDVVKGPVGILLTFGVVLGVGWFATRGRKR